MKSGLRAGAVALALIASSYGVVATTYQSAAAEPAAAVPHQPAQEPPTEVKAADTKTTLPMGTVADVLVNDQHEQVYVSMPSNDTVVVTDLAGAITATVTGLNVPRDMTLSPDGSTLYVAEGDARIATIDVATSTVEHIALSSGVCARSLTYTGGKVWFTHSACSDDSEPGIGVIDVGAGEATTGAITVPQRGTVDALPGVAERLAFSSESSLGVYDVSGDTPAEVVTRSLAEPRSSCADAALIGGGDQLVTACSLPNQHQVFNTADLSTAAAIPSGQWPGAVAVTPDGRYLAAGISSGWTTTDVYIRDIQDGTPGDAVRTYDLGYNRQLVGRGLAFSAAGRLYAVTTEPSPEPIPVLHVLADATKYPTAVTVDAPTAVSYGGTVEATGALTDGPGTATVSLRRTDRNGAHELGEIAVVDNAFSFTDTPGITGPVTYQVSYAGDDTHQPAQGSATVIMRPLPYDINADGYAETVVGVPGENIGSDTNTGMFHVLFGGPSGTTGSGSKSYHQDTSGVPGSGEDGDQLGFTNTSGDFNGDGYADVAVSATGENIGSAKDAGMVLVFYGSASGLLTSGVTSLYNDYAGMFFGLSLTTGDFDGDGRDDLAVGAPGAESGYVFVYPGSSTGLSRTNQDVFSQETESVPGRPDQDDIFGWAVSAGDVNGDGKSDLAVGAIFDWEDKGWSIGSATVLYGSESGLTGTGAQRFSKETPGVPGAGGSFNEDKGDVSDQFGNAVALADFNGDGKADLAAAAAGAPTTGVDGNRKADAGTVTVLYSDGAKISTTGAIQVTQKTSGMPGHPGANDFFGTTMTAGDANGDGRHELAIFSPGDTYVTVVPGASGGLAWGSAKGWTQNSSGIPGSSEKGDYWGNSLRFADIKGTGNMALIVGADGENSGKGAITVIYSTSSGLTGTGAKYFSQNSTGISGTAENGDWFGSFY